MKKVAEIIGLIVVAVGILAGVALILKKYFCNDECCCGCEDDDLDEFEPDDECECECCKDEDDCDCCCDEECTCEETCDCECDGASEETASEETETAE